MRLSDPQLEALGDLAVRSYCFTVGGRRPPPGSIHPSTGKKLVSLGLARVLATGALMITDAGRIAYAKAMGRS
jgi:hypothetical protein